MSTSISPSTSFSLYCIPTSQAADRVIALRGPSIPSILLHTLLVTPSNHHLYLYRQLKGQSHLAVSHSSSNGLSFYPISLISKEASQIVQKVRHRFMRFIRH